MKVTSLGTASVLLEYAGLRLLTDPVFDPEGVTYSMAPAGVPERWFASTKQYVTPVSPAAIGHIDAVLLSHDHHRDNLDVAGRTFLNSDAVDAVLTTPAGARRLSRTRSAVTGLRAGETAALGTATVTAVTAQHGPRYVPQTGQVTGFALSAPGEPSVWISGDTVLTPALRLALAGLQGIDVAIVHGGGVRFPTAPLVGSAIFTFDPAQFVEACTILNPGMILPIHRVGWTHFQPEDALRSALDAAGLSARTRWLDLGETVDIPSVSGG